MENIILDTDFETDCDDVAALSLLYTLENKGDINILGVISSTNDILVAKSIAAFNIKYQRQNIRLGCNFNIKNCEEYILHKKRCEEAKQLYSQKFIESVDSEKLNSYPVEDAVELYRELLENSADNSVTVCTIGLFTILAKVLLLYPELVHQKVKRVVSMANLIFLNGNSGFNVNMDSAGSAYFLENFKNEIFISYEGKNVLTGAVFSELSNDNLLKISYETFGKKEKFLRPSWDQITLLIAAMNTETQEFINIFGQGKINYNPQCGEHFWIIDNSSNHYCFAIKQNYYEELAKLIDKLCMEFFKEELKEGKL